MNASTRTEQALAEALESHDRRYRRHWRKAVIVGAAVIASAAALAWSERDLRRESAHVEAALVTYLAGTGMTVRDGSCDDGDFVKDDLHLWTCRVVIPETVLTPEFEQTWDVAVADDGAVVDASRHR